VNARQLRELIVRPALLAHNLQDGEEMVMFTAAVETELAEYVRQNGTDGNYAVARGPFQMEPTTFEWLQTMPQTKSLLLNRTVDELQWDFKLAVLACRLRYLVVREPLPKSDDVDGMARYWKVYYNGSPAGLTAEQAKNKYLKLVKGVIR